MKRRRPTAPAPPRARPRLRPRLVLIAIAALVVYANGLSNPFIFDDEASVADNRSIQEWRLAHVLFPEREVPTAGRPSAEF